MAPVVVVVVRGYGEGQLWGSTMQTKRENEKTVHKVGKQRTGKAPKSIKLGDSRLSRQQCAKFIESSQSVEQTPG